MRRTANIRRLPHNLHLRLTLNQPQPLHLLRRAPQLPLPQRLQELLRFVRRRPALPREVREERAFWGAGGARAGGGGGGNGGEVDVDGAGGGGEEGTEAGGEEG